MARRPKVIVTGHRGIDRGLKRLERKDARRVVMKGLRAGSKISAKAIQAGAPKGRSGLLRKVRPVVRVGRASGKKRRKNLTKNELGLNVHFDPKRFYAENPFPGKGKRPGANRARKRTPRTTPFYPLVVEFGEPAIGRAPDPFIRRGHQQSRGQAKAAVVRTIKAELRAALRKLKA